jgi:hypothetical protein
LKYGHHLQGNAQKNVHGYTIFCARKFTPSLFDGN